MIKSISDTVLLKSKKDVLRVHLYFKLLQYGIRPLEKDMEIIIELFEAGGYSNKEEQTLFLENCITKKFKRTTQSVRNTLSKYVRLGVFLKEKNKSLNVNEKFIPKINSDIIVLQHAISHASRQ